MTKHHESFHVYLEKEISAMSELTGFIILAVAFLVLFPIILVCGTNSDNEED